MDKRDAAIRKCHAIECYGEHHAFASGAVLWLLPGVTQMAGAKLDAWYGEWIGEGITRPPFSQNAARSLNPVLRPISPSPKNSARDAGRRVGARLD